MDTGFSLKSCSKLLESITSYGFGLNQSKPIVIEGLATQEAPRA